MQQAKNIEKAEKGNNQGMYSREADESSLENEKIAQNAGNIAIQKRKNFELYVQCLTSVGENPSELMNQVIL